VRVIATIPCALLLAATLAAQDSSAGTGGTGSDGTPSVPVPSPSPIASRAPPGTGTGAGSAEGDPAKEPSKFFSSEDGWFDVSGFLDEKFGFLPVVIPITEPAIGYGAAGALAFLDAPLGSAKEGLSRPDLTAVGGLATENGTWGGFAGDLRYWDDDRVQTLVGVVHAAVELEFYGIGPDDSLGRNPLDYELEPTGGLLQAKVRLGDSRVSAGASYVYATTDVTFEAPAGTPELPDFESNSDVGGLTPSLTYDTRDTIFTPRRGSYVEGSVAFYSEAFGGDDEFQQAKLVAMHYAPLGERWTLGLRADLAASFGTQPFYMRPFITMRGIPIFRYQGEELAQAEAEVRWQFWKRVSLVGFGGIGSVWNDFERLEDGKNAAAAGLGLRYEIAREYGIHVGLDVAVGPEEAAIYVTFGSAWTRP